ncbi:hypothetical protein MPTK1_7g03480 [Marchantia polymorpha subsp. ruderalis]|nr:hypothetical protein MARPO_0074s0048 [Marchantia polymorpha]PTQ35060.1 hypothetical protein MARPO_0074s0048 [Marchantia polymorpha]BBN16105.1 hypothetical protein Mp_7g03480 [Marchantia polymorpha subsp. ruderalis]BBN16106.1 hypothetical protein Mp_7g03480 [Marchantia polymorpha subsp. ruderalis]|eukprot:PTQ35059.1 hypothetical protein MARPO_0074s0048 [Marchantia polymorpha]
MTEKDDEGNEESSVSTELEEEVLEDEEDEDVDDPEEAARLEKLEIQLEEDSDLLEEAKDDRPLENSDFESDEAKADDEDCPFCDYMKLGPCGKSFNAWEKCTEAAEKDGRNVFQDCSLVTGILTACMRNNVSYYGPVLEAQKVVEGSSDQADVTTVLERNVEKKVASKGEK